MVLFFILILMNLNARFLIRNENVSHQVEDVFFFSNCWMLQFVVSFSLSRAYVTIFVSFRQFVVKSFMCGKMTENKSLLDCYRLNVKFIWEIEKKREHWNETSNRIGWDQWHKRRSSHMMLTKWMQINYYDLNETSTHIPKTLRTFS